MHRHRRPRDHRNPGPAAASDPTAEPAGRRRARPGPAIRRSSEGGDIFFILTNADGAMDFKIVDGAGGRSGAARTGTTWSRTAGPADPRRHRASPTTWSGSSARTRLTAHRRARPRERRGARHRLRRGGLSRSAWRAATNTTPTIIRFVYPSPTTPRAAVRLRHGDPRADAAQDPGDPLRPRPGRAT